jgi:NADH:ubiquinone oxidoreductase subunit H
VRAPPIRTDEWSTELHPYSSSLCTLLFLGGWLPILSDPQITIDDPLEELISNIPGSIWFSIKVILFLFLYIWVRAAFPRYRYDQLMGLGWKVFLPLSLAWVVAVSGVLVTFRWLP